MQTFPVDFQGTYVGQTEGGEFTNPRGEKIAYDGKLQVLYDNPGQRGGKAIAEIGVNPLNAAGVNWQALRPGLQVRFVGVGTIPDRGEDRVGGLRASWLGPADQEPGSQYTSTDVQAKASANGRDRVAS